MSKWLRDANITALFVSFPRLEAPYVQGQLLGLSRKLRNLLGPVSRKLISLRKTWQHMAEISGM
jgi:hypothetical protein